MKRGLYFSGGDLISRPGTDYINLIIVTNVSVYVSYGIYKISVCESNLKWFLK